MSGTIFSWPGRQRSSWTLAGCIFLMLFLHSAAFFVFQAALPGRSSAPRTAPPVQILTPFAPDGTPSPENEALLRWIDAEDPAFLSRVPVVEPPNLLDVPYRPSFATPSTPPLAAPPEPPSIQFPPAREPLKLILDGSRSRNSASPPAVAPQPTRVAFSSPIEIRAPKETLIRPPAAAKQPVPPTQFLLGVDADGAVRFFFLQQSSGVQALDEAATAVVRSLRFTTAAGAATAWGTATIYWGDDATAEPE